MSHLHQGVGAMPGPTSNKAPSFNSQAAELLDLFELFDDLASTCGLTDVDKCKCLVRYVDLQTKRFWVTLNDYEQHNFITLKSTILDQYPGASKGQRYTVRDLELIVIKQLDREITTETDLVDFYTRFRPIAVWLVKNGKISDRDRNKYFWQGLVPHARRLIMQRLVLKSPDLNRNEPVDFDDIMRAGRHVFTPLTSTSS